MRKSKWRKIKRMRHMLSLIEQISRKLVNRKGVINGKKEYTTKITILRGIRFCIY